MTRVIALVIAPAARCHAIVGQSAVPRSRPDAPRRPRRSVAPGETTPSGSGLTGELAAASTSTRLGTHTRFEAHATFEPELCAVRAFA
jgi:hypothetical protein